MRLLTGDQCGLIKESIPEFSRQPDDKNNEKQKAARLTEECVNRIDPNEHQSRTREVVDMAYTSDGNNSFAALRSNGTVELWEGECAPKSFGKYRRFGLVRNIFDELESSSENDDKDTSAPQPRPLALGCYKDRLIAADTLGRVSVLPTTGSPVVARYSAFSKQSSMKITYTKGNHQNVNICTAAATDYSTGTPRVALGGRERETTLLDVESGQVVWKAKNLPPDPQTLLQHPIWSTALIFLQNSQTMVSGTAYKQVRLYDVRANSVNRRPVSYSPEGLLSARVTALCQVDEYQLVVGDATGELLSLDTRILGRKQKGKTSATLGRYPGPGGSIRQIKKHESLPIVAVVGLDRMLRTYDAKKRRQLDCVYLKQRVNCILFGSDGTWEVESETKKVTTSDLSQLEEDDGDIEQEDNIQDYVDSDDDEQVDDDSEKEDNDVEEDNDESEEASEGSESSGSEEEDDSEESDEEDEDEDEDEGPVQSGRGQSKAPQKKKRRT